jgi:hypothetical protein
MLWNRHAWAFIWLGKWGWAWQAYSRFMVLGMGYQIAVYRFFSGSMGGTGVFIIENFFRGLQFLLLAIAFISIYIFTVASNPSSSHKEI